MLGSKSSKGRGRFRNYRNKHDRRHCHECGRHVSESYGYDNEIRIRHLSILGHKTFVRIRPKRYECPYCEGNPTTTRMTWYESKSPSTTAYERHVLLELTNSTVADVGIKEEIGYEAVMGIMDRHIEGEVDWNKSERSDTIGLDEISLKKGHKDFVTIITGGAGRVIRAVLRGREKATTKAFLRSIPKRSRRHSRQYVAICMMVMRMRRRKFSAIK
jgi:transposase